MFDIIFPSSPVYLFHTSPFMLFVILQCRPFSFTSVLYFLLQITLSPFLFTLAAITLFTRLTFRPIFIYLAFASVYFWYHILLHLTNFCLPQPPIPPSLNCLIFTLASPAQSSLSPLTKNPKTCLLLYPFELLQFPFGNLFLTATFSLSPLPPLLPPPLSLLSCFPPRVIKWWLGWHSWCSWAGSPSSWQLCCSVVAKFLLGQ